jgi:hypothetical protein
MITGIIIGTIVGVVLTFFTAFAFNNLDTFGDHEWVFPVLIAGMLYIVFFASIFGFLGYDADKENKINETIQNTLNSNYDNVVNFHNGNTNKSFVSDGSKYTFDYDKKTKTLTVFTDTNSSVDAVFINGIKQNNSVKKGKTSDNTNKKKDCVSYQTDDKNKTNDNVDTDNASSTTTVATDTDLQQKIQNKIQSKYNGAVMTSFDTINLSGTFSCDDIQYNFAYKDNMLEVSNINDINDVTYYKISN